MGVAVEGVGRQFNGRQRGAGAFDAGGARSYTLNFETFHQDLADGHARRQARERVLENVLHACPLPAQFAGRQAGHFGATEADAAGRRLDQGAAPSGR